MENKGILCDPVQEVGSGDFGHGRRTSAVKKVARGFSERPGASFPEIFDRKNLETEGEGSKQIIGMVTCCMGSLALRFEIVKLDAVH
jgi:hypothetical protein